MRLDRRAAALAGMVLIALAGPASVTWATETTPPASTADQPPAATSTPEAEIAPDAPAPHGKPEADPRGRAPGCPLRDHTPPRLLIG